MHSEKTTPPLWSGYQPKELMLKRPRKHWSERCVVTWISDTIEGPKRVPRAVTSTGRFHHPLDRLCKKRQVKPLVTKNIVSDVGV